VRGLLLALLLLPTLLSAQGVLHGHARWVMDLAFSPNGKQLLSGSDDHTLRLWTLDDRSNRVLRRFDNPVTACTFSPDGKDVVAGTYDGTLQLCHADTGKTRLSFTGHTDTVTTVFFDRSGDYLASGSADDSLIIWDAASGEPLLTFHQGNEYDVTCAAFHPDATTLVTGDGENEIKLWDSENGEEIATLAGHTSVVTAVDFSPDGTRIVSASWDQTLRLWDADVGRQISVLRGHEAEVTAVRSGTPNPVCLTSDLSVTHARSAASR